MRPGANTSVREMWESTSVCAGVGGSAWAKGRTTSEASPPICNLVKKTLFGPRLPSDCPGALRRGISSVTGTTWRVSSKIKSLLCQKKTSGEKFFKFSRGWLCFFNERTDLIGKIQLEAKHLNSIAERWQSWFRHLSCDYFISMVASPSGLSEIHLASTMGNMYIWQCKSLPFPPLINCIYVYIYLCSCPTQLTAAAIVQPLLSTLLGRINHLCLTSVSPSLGTSGVSPGHLFNLRGSSYKMIRNCYL